MCTNSHLSKSAIPRRSPRLRRFARGIAPGTFRAPFVVSSHLLNEISHSVARDLWESLPHNFGAGVLAQESPVCGDGFANHFAYFIVARFAGSCGRRLRALSRELPQNFVARISLHLCVTEFGAGMV
jgi:hypothetical protein